MSKIFLEEQNPLKLGAIYKGIDGRRFRLIGFQRKSDFIFQCFDGDIETRKVLLVDRKDLETFFVAQKLRIESLFTAPAPLPRDLT